jgi:predicted nucleic acid-binding protein
MSAKSGATIGAMPAASEKKPIIQCWDSGLFIDYLMDVGDVPSSKSEVFDRLIQDAERGLIRIALSFVVLAEVRPKKRNNASIKKIETMLESDRAYFEWFPVTRAIGARAQRIGAAYSIEVPDAIHLATAIEAKAEVFLTYDGSHADKKDDGLLALNGKIKDRDLDGNAALRIELPIIKTAKCLNRRITKPEIGRKLPLRSQQLRRRGTCVKCRHALLVFFLDLGLRFSSFSLGTFTIAFMKASKLAPAEDIASDLGMCPCYPRCFGSFNVWLAR